MAICLRRAAAAAACGAGTVTVGAGAPCFTVFVASIVLSAPCGMILFEDVGTKQQTKKILQFTVSFQIRKTRKPSQTTFPTITQLPSDKTVNTFLAQPV